ncbi:Tn3 family transposase [Streptomyces coeruleorubidus]|uniref:Tn3 family transposase n=1 Tax=Streptomyces coeruleorubidus TaxID=116188 RepID=UPI0036640484
MLSTKTIDWDLIRQPVNTLLLQDILSEERWQKRLTDADRRALSPLLWTHVNPYGRFELDMNLHLALAAASIVPGPRTVPEAEAARSAADGGSGSAS